MDLSDLNVVEDCPGWLVHILSFLTFQDRSCVLQLNHRYSTLPDWKGWWKVQSEFAANEFKLYCPETLGPNESWQGYFEDLWGMRFLWKGASNNDAKRLDKDQRVKVFARLKPMLPMPYHSMQSAVEGGDIEEKEDEQQVVLPLHQRLSLIRASAKKHLSTKQAMQVLVKQGSWWSGRPLDEEIDAEEVKDATNVQPLTPEELEELEKPQHFRFKVHTVNEELGEIVMAAPTVGLRDFAFNGVMTDQVEQVQVYERVGHRLVCDALNGWNGTLFVYGQTGSGKTHTMFGPTEEAAMGLDEKNMGLVPRMCQEILAALEKKQASQQIEARLSLSYIEVYGDAVFDLLKAGESVGHSKVTAQRYVLEGEAKVPVSSVSDVQRLLKLGEQHKTKAATKMNERSTRAHTLLILSVSQHCMRTDARVDSLLFLGDLGGSERLGKSDATGVHKQEATQINMGLLSLKKVIAALNKGSQHVPYHDSKLTMLLSAGLGGASRTRVVVCLNQDPTHAAETLESLRFGEECSLVKTQRGNNVTLVVSMIKKIDEEIEGLKDLIQKKERWETVETRRQDVNVEHGTFEEGLSKIGGEVIKTTRLVGAEEEHKRLQQLYDRRRQLLGQEE